MPYRDAAPDNADRPYLPGRSGQTQARGAAAHLRAAGAAVRAAELTERLRKLQRGPNTDAEDVVSARHAQDAAQDAAAAAAAHTTRAAALAAQAHRRAADVFDTRGDAERAAHHRRAAAADRALADGPSATAPVANANEPDGIAD